MAFNLRTDPLKRTGKRSKSSWYKGPHKNLPDLCYTDFFYFLCLVGRLRWFSCYDNLLLLCCLAHDCMHLYDPIWEKKMWGWAWFHPISTVPFLISACESIINLLNRWLTFLISMAIPFFLANREIARKLKNLLIRIGGLLYPNHKHLDSIIGYLILSLVSLEAQYKKGNMMSFKLNPWSTGGAIVTTSVASTLCGCKSNFTKILMVFPKQIAHNTLWKRPKPLPWIISDQVKK